MSRAANPSFPLKVRLATADDIPAIVSIANAAFAIETFLEGSRTDHERMAAMMQKGEFLVGEDQSGRLLASVYIEKRGEGAYLGMLAVDPTRQGSGIGRQMTEAAEAYCREHGCRYIDIVVLSLRPELLPLYRKLGFVETGTEEFRPSRPLKPGIECYGIKMSKTL